MSGRKNFSALQSPSWTKNQINMRKVNRRKSNLIVYTEGFHTDLEIPEMDSMMLLCAEERSILGFRRERRGREL